MKKTLKNTLLYISSIIIPVVSILGIAACVYVLFINNTAKHTFTYANYTIGALIIVFILLIKGMSILRVKTREWAEYDARGVNKSKNSYYKLSKKERDAIELEQRADNERILDSKTLRKMIKEGSKDPQKDLDKLIGMSKIKQQLKDISARMEYEQLDKRKKKSKDNDFLSGMHMCFLGRPGTGKTTCARIITGLLYQYGYIKKNMVIEVDGNFLKSTNPGNTAKRTAMLIEHSYGGVLFIDEAYSLLEDSKQGYCQEAIATIVKAMEDNRDKFILILAGYDNEMKQLINSNPGFFSRIKHYLWFEDYTTEELGDIFISMAQQAGLYVPAETLDRFKLRINKEMPEKNFGNARSVRNCLEKAIDKHASNYINHVIDKDKQYILCPEDIDLYTKEMQFFS